MPSISDEEMTAEDLAEKLVELYEPHIGDPVAIRLAEDHITLSLSQFTCYWLHEDEEKMIEATGAYMASVLVYNYVSESETYTLAALNEIEQLECDESCRAKLIALCEDII